MDVCSRVLYGIRWSLGSVSSFCSALGQKVASIVSETNFEREVPKVNICRKAFCPSSLVGGCFEHYHMSRNVPKTTTGIAAFNSPLRLGASVLCTSY